ncbi:MAG: hypothetical protein PHN72_06250 [Bacilli bacterium]|nr:hypothetical protein [Bacilli bacterium]
MKYLKVTLGLFAVALCVSLFNVQAQVKKMVDITIPIFSREYMTKGYKSTYSYQYIKKTKCQDDVSGDGRTIIAGLHETTGSANPNYDPARVIAAPNQDVQFDNNSKRMGSWNLYLNSQKSLPTTASFWGTWTIDK